MTPLVGVFGSSTARPGSPEWREASALGRALGTAGLGVITGGYGGLMEAVSAAAAESGGPVVGVTAPAVFPGRDGPNRFLTEEHPAEDLVARIGILTDRAAALVALPGSLGTATELLVAWNLAFVAPFSRVPPKPVVVVGEPLGGVAREIAARTGADLSLLALVATGEEAAAVVRARLDARSANLR